MNATPPELTTEPATAAMIEAWLRSAVVAGMGDPTIDFVLEHARAWVAQARPKGFRRGRSGRCWGNSQLKLIDGFASRLTYVEGFAWPIGVGWPVHHAWLVDAAGLVIDLTWREPELAAYFGVPIRSKYVAETMVRRRFCGPLIDRYVEEWPLVNGGTPIQAGQPSEPSRPPRSRRRSRLAVIE